MPSPLRLALTTALLVGALLGQASRADVVVLKNHVEYKGAVTSEDDMQVTVLSDGTEWTFPRDNVAEVRRDRASADEERVRDKRRRAAAAVARAAAAEEPPPVHRERPAGARTHAALTPDTSSVTVYGTSWCGYCKRARAFFRRRGVPFADKDIEADGAANVEMQRKCSAAGVYAAGVPVIDAFGTVVPGFDEERLDEILKRHGF